MQNINFLSLNMGILALLSSGQVKLSNKSFLKFVENLEKSDFNKNEEAAMVAEDAIEILIDKLKGKIKK